MKLSPSLLLPLLLAAPLLAADFPEPYNTEAGNPAPPMTPEQALASLKMPPGFTATLFAHEPEVRNPIAMTWDGRGRMWVAENYTYAEKSVRAALDLRDRVLIFEDRDGDGRAEGRKVFTDSVQMLTSVEVGRGGVWLMCPPALLFVPDANSDDVPDAAPQVVLDGFTMPRDNYHNFANGLRWGPDGWLYGRCGASAPGEIGAPGAPAIERIPLRGTMWRYHPEQKVFEALTHGTTNPWGHDWDEHGELFFINTVNGHLWHAVPGMHFVRPHTLDPNPHAYALIDTHADHWHFDTGKGWQASRDGAANDLGGGHAHCGAMIPQGAAWPAEFRGKLLTLNFHGRCANVERLERSGSGFVAKHEPNAFTWGDPWFRAVDIQQGPDGAAYVLDWSDTGECHENTGVHRTSGRIYRIAPLGAGAASKLPDFARMHDGGLAALLREKNVWIAREALRELTERAVAGAPLTDAIELSRRLLQGESDTVLRLRALWTLRAMSLGENGLLRDLLGDSDEHLRAWAIRIITDAWPLDTVASKRPGGDEGTSPTLLAEFTRMAREDRSALVRLVLASTLQRLPFAQRADLASALVAHAEDADDHNLPELVWYGLIPLGESDPQALVRVAEAARWPKIARWIARRLALDSEKNPAPFDALLSLAARQSDDQRLAVLRGVNDGFRGWRKAQKPAAWDAFAAALAPIAGEPEQAIVRGLATLFGDGRALDEVKRVALDKNAEMTAREAALRTLIDARPPDLRALCEQLTGTPHLASAAVRGLALFDDPAIGERLARDYGKMSRDRAALIEALVTRPVWAKALLDQIAAGKIPRADLTAFHARQIRNFNDPALTARLTEVWGELRESAADKRELIAKLKPQLAPTLLAKADVSKGRAVFAQTCAACHKLYGEGGAIGPDLTGSGRDNLDYLLDNIADPSAVVTADFRLTTLTLKDGRILTGMIAARTDRTLTLRTLTETQTVERADIAKQEESAQSMMPEGLLLALQPEQVRDLFAYLMGKQQVPLPGEK